MAEANRKLEVLIVEDDAFLRKILVSKFSKEGFGTRAAANGEEALNLTRQSKPSLVLLDLIIPKMNGFEYLSEIRTDPAFKDLPVIALSNLSQDEDIERANKLGILFFMTKADYSINEIVIKTKEEYAKHMEKVVKGA